MLILFIPLILSTFWRYGSELHGVPALAIRVWGGLCVLEDAVKVSWTDSTPTQLGARTSWAVPCSCSNYPHVAGCENLEETWEGEVGVLTMYHLKRSAESA